MKDSERKRKRRPEILDAEQFEEELKLRYGWLLVEEMNHERKMRRKAIRLSRKRRKQTDLWVV